MVTTQATPTPTTGRFRGRGLVNELIQEYDRDVHMGTKPLSYDRQQQRWLFPSYFDEEYLNHTQEYKSEEVCTAVDVFTVPPEVGTLQEMGRCDILYLPEMNRDDPYYNSLFMTQAKKDAYNREGCLLYTSPSPRDS